MSIFKKALSSLAEITKKNKRLQHALYMDIGKGNEMPVQNYRNVSPATLGKEPYEMSLRFPQKTEKLAQNPYYSRDHITREDYAKAEATEVRKERREYLQMLREMSRMKPYNLKTDFDPSQFKFAWEAERNYVYVKESAFYSKSPTDA